MQLTDRLTERFLRYISCPSESGNERDMCLLLEEELERLGLTVRREEIGGGFGSNGWNIYTCLEGAGRPLLLSAHMDTVRPGDPVRPVLDGDTIRTDGSTVLGADDKAGVAVIMETLESLIETGDTHRTVEVLFTVGEETGLNGSKRADYRKIRSRQAVSFDGSGIGRIVTKNAIHEVLQVTVRGKAAHSGLNCDKGIHALCCAAEAVAAIGSGHMDADTTLNTANFLCPGAVNVVPDLATFEIELRCFSEELLEKHKDRIRRILDEKTAASGSAYSIRETRTSPGMDLPDSDPLIGLVSGVMRQAGLSPVLKRGYGGHDAVSFTANGLSGVNVGVGYLNAHGPDERISVSDLKKAADFAALLVRTLD